MQSNAELSEHPEFDDEDGYPDREADTGKDGPGSSGEESDQGGPPTYETIEPAGADSISTEPTDTGITAEPTGTGPAAASTTPAAGAASRPGRPTAAPLAEDDAPVFADDERTTFQQQWRELQGTFVDEPRQAVEQADELVSSIMKTLTDTLTQHKQRLEGQWNGGDEVQTEDLRLALRRYRTLFNQLLTI